MAPSHICLCTTHRCKDKKTANGEPGVTMNVRTLRKHEVADRTAKLRNLVSEAQARIVEEHEKDLSVALENMSLSNTTNIPGSPAPLPDHDRYRIHQIRRSVKHISEIKDQVKDLLDEVNAINIEFAMSTEGMIKHSLRQIELIYRHATEHKSRLLYNSRKSKQPAIVAVRDATLEDLRVLMTRLDELQSSLAEALDKRADQRVRDGITLYDSRHHFMDDLTHAYPIIQLAALLTVACHVVLGFSRRGCHWVFSIVQYIVHVTVVQAIGDLLLLYFKNILATFPRDIRSATAQFNLDTRSTVYAACPKCHATYKPNFVNNIPVYQERCNFSCHGRHCAELLVRPHRMGNVHINVPIKPYIAFDFKDWMGGLLSRAGYEEKMDGAWERMELSPDGTLTDIFQGSVIREFKGSDGKTHFSLAGDAETGRYLFSLCFDDFNPLGNGGNGGKVGMISLVCLNLPIEEWYKPENMFLAGLIPGPKGPPLDAINPYIRPIVDVFLEFWTGVRFLRTWMYEAGRLILCALILIVCDQPAARKIGGFSSFKQAYFCWHCWCNNMEHGFNNHDCHGWKRRTNEESRKHAQEFHEAASPKLAAQTFDNTGLRWSQLLRLPYFDPTRFVVVEPMHNLFLGLIKEHVQGILGSGSSPDSEPQGPEIDIPADPSNPLPTGKAVRASVRRLIRLLKKPLDFTSEQQSDKFDAAVKVVGGSTMHVAALVYVGRRVGCFPATLSSKGRDMSKTTKNGSNPVVKKKELAESIVRWHLKQVPRPLPPNVAGKVLTRDELKAIWEDLERMVKPSWVTSVPSASLPSGPKIKSDQWRTVGSLYLPVTLIRLWSKLNPTHDEQGRQELLDFSMSLLSAIVIASSRATSDRNGNEYLAQMIDYRQDLDHLFSEYECHPNHHMAMHIPEYMSMYGPVHGWWAYPFERMIGVLQRISTNYKPVQYEETIGRSWHRSSNFRAYFLKGTCPDAIRKCASMFEKLIRPQVRDTLPTDAALLAEELPEPDAQESYNQFSGKEERLSDTILAAFTRALNSDAIPPRAKSVAQIYHRGISYAVRETHEGNSGIFVKGFGAPYAIENIVRFPDSGADDAPRGTWLVVRRYQDANVDYDPYLRYPFLRAGMWGAGLEPDIDVVPINEIDTHFAKCVVPWEDKEVAVIVSLSRILLV